MRSETRALGFACGLWVLAACGSEDREGPEGTAGSAGAPNGGASGMGGGGSGPCNVAVVARPPASALHVAECSEVDYDTNPPSGGPHYGVWPAFQTYDFPVPAGYLVHALEHGAVVFWYDCPEGCPDEVEEVQTFIDALPADPACEGTPSERRAILVPSPGLETRWAVSSWGFALTASCFDETAFEEFYLDHYAQGLEDFCTPGRAFSEDPCL